MSRSLSELNTPAEESPYKKNGALLLELLNPQKRPEMFLAERSAIFALTLATLVTPGMFLRDVCGRCSLRWRKLGVEIYVFFKVILAFAILFADQGKHFFYSVVLSTYILVDLFSNLFGLILA